MMFSIGVVIGLIIGGVLLRITVGRSTGWLALSLGLAAVIVFIAGWRFDFDAPRILMPLAIALPVAATAFGGGALLRGERRWSNWLGFVCALAPFLFWVWFAIGEILGPPH